MATAQVGGFAGWVLSTVRRVREQAAKPELELVETLSLGGRRQLTLVKCGGQNFLVGCSGDGVTSIVAVKAETEPTDPAVSFPQWGAGF